MRNSQRLASSPCTEDQDNNGNGWGASMLQLIIRLLGLGLGLALISLLARIIFGKDFGVTSTEVALLLVPTIIFLLINGMIRKLKSPFFEMELAQTFREVALKKLEPQIMKLKVERLIHTLNAAEKGSMGELSGLKKRNINALIFRLGHGDYDAWAIKKYFETLSQKPDFRYLIIESQEGKFFGLYELSRLQYWFRKEYSENTQNDEYVQNSYDFEKFEKFANWLNQGDEGAKRELAALPGFVGADLAVSKSAERLEVLVKMEELGRDELPVVGEEGDFVGIVTRERVTASMMIEILTRLAKKQGAGPDN